MEADAIAKRPDRAVQVAAVLAQGSLIEGTFARLMTAILHAEQKGVAAMLGTIVNFRTKLDLATVVISAKYGDLEVRVSAAVFAQVSVVMAQRNKFAHHIFAVCDELPNDLLLIEPEARIPTRNLILQEPRQLLDKNLARNDDLRTDSV